MVALDNTEMLGLPTSTGFSECVPPPPLKARLRDKINPCSGALQQPYSALKTH